MKKITKQYHIFRDDKGVLCMTSHDRYDEASAWVYNSVTGNVPMTLAAIAKCKTEPNVTMDNFITEVKDKCREAIRKTEGNKEDAKLGAALRTLRDFMGPDMPGFMPIRLPNFW